MTRNKHGFKDFRLEDLTGWINTRDYASEIEDKQSLSLINYNFKWNKLVSSKWVDNVYTGSSLIQWFTTDGDDKWHIESTNLYKNGSIAQLSTVYNLYIENINWDLFDISIDWNDYVWDKTLASETLAYDDFVADLQAMLWGGYTVVKDVSETWIVISKWSWEIVSITNPSVIKKIHIPSWQMIESWFVADGINITVWWTNIKRWYDQSSSIASLTTYIWTQLPWYTVTYEGEYIVLYKDDLSSFTFSSSDVTSRRYWINAISGPSSTEEYQYKNTITLNSHTYTYNYPLWAIDYKAFFDYVVNWGTYNISNEYYTMAKCYETLKNSWDFVSSATFTDQWDNSQTRNWGLRGKEREELTISNSIYYRDWEWTYKVTSTNNWLTLTLTNTWVTSAVIISDYTNSPTWTAVNNWLWLISNEFYDITVSSLWTLITSRSWLAPIFIELDGTVTIISSWAVWEPTVWTIYNWKIILGWYADSDNIIFSQTEDPVAAGNEMLNFAAYSAWGQSVSGWNKGTVKWFIVGENWLYVLKENEIWYTNSEKDTWTSFNFTFKKITSNWTANQSSTSEVDQETFYFDYINRAVRRLWYEQNLTTLRDVAISREIEDLFLSIPDGDEWGRSVTTSYAYPLYKIEFALEWATQYTVGDWNYRIPNTTAIYNVENKSWATENNKLALMPIHSYKGFFATYDGSIYQDDVWNTLSDWYHLSKEYVFIDDVDYKRIGEIEIVWDLMWVWWIKNLEIEVLIDWENVDIWEEEFPFKRIISAEDWETVRFREKIDLYDDGRIFQFSLKHNWVWRVEINDVNARVKPLKISQYYY